MALKVIWTPIALEQLESILTYLTDSWSDQIIRNFTQKLEDRVQMISNHPGICKRSQRYHGARECLITKHNTLFYITRDEYLYVVTLWDNRQDPKLLEQQQKK